MPATTGNTLGLYAGAPIWSPVQIGTTAISVNSQAPGTIGTNCFLVGTVSSADGSYLQKIRFTFTSTTGVISVVASNINIFLSTISSGATSSADTYLYHTLQVPAQTISAVTTAPIMYEVPISIPIQTSRHVLVAQTVAANTNSAWVAHLIRGDY
jgi:hypothetical protein